MRISKAVMLSLAYLLTQFTFFLAGLLSYIAIITILIVMMAVNTFLLPFEAAKVFFVNAYGFITMDCDDNEKYENFTSMFLYPKHLLIIGVGTYLRKNSSELLILTSTQIITWYTAPKVAFLISSALIIINLSYRLFSNDDESLSSYLILTRFLGMNPVNYAINIFFNTQIGCSQYTGTCGYAKVLDVGALGEMDTYMQSTNLKSENLKEFSKFETCGLSLADNIFCVKTTFECFGKVVVFKSKICFFRKLFGINTFEIHRGKFVLPEDVYFDDLKTFIDKGIAVVKFSEEGFSHEISIREIIESGDIKKLLGFNSDPTLKPAYYTGATEVLNLLARIPNVELLVMHNKLFFGKFQLDSLLACFNNNFFRKHFKKAKDKLYKSDICEILDRLNVKNSYRPYKNRFSPKVEMVLQSSAEDIEKCFSEIENNVKEDLTVDDNKIIGVEGRKGNLKSLEEIDKKIGKIMEVVQEEIVEKKIPKIFGIDRTYSQVVSSQSLKNPRVPKPRITIKQVREELIAGGANKKSPDFLKLLTDTFKTEYKKNLEDEKPKMVLAWSAPTLKTALENNKLALIEVKNRYSALCNLTEECRELTEEFQEKFKTEVFLSNIPSAVDKAISKSKVSKLSRSGEKQRNQASKAAKRKMSKAGKDSLNPKKVILSGEIKKFGICLAAAKMCPDKILGKNNVKMVFKNNELFSWSGKKFGLTRMTLLSVNREIRKAFDVNKKTLDLKGKKLKMVESDPLETPRRHFAYKVMPQKIFYLSANEIFKDHPDPVLREIYLECERDYEEYISLAEGIFKKFIS